MIKTQIVLGTFFGDEGKGSTVQNLCKKELDSGNYPLVIRYSGGPQAGHRVIYNNIEHICSSFGSGVLLNIPTYLNENVLIDPISLKLEYEKLISNNINPVIYINRNCRVITPYDVNANINDNINLNNGSCGKGIFKTFNRYNKCFINYYLKDIIININNFIKIVKNFYKIENDELTVIDNLFIESFNWLKTYAVIVSDIYEIPDVNSYIFEGSQGLLLDMETGFMPHCTPSKVGLNAIPEKYLNDVDVYFVMRNYITRHGNGYLPQYAELVYEFFNLDEPTNRDDGYQGKFRYGIFNIDLLKRVFDRICLDNYKAIYNIKTHGVITHMDCLKTNDIPILENNKIKFIKDNNFIKKIKYYFDDIICSYENKLNI
jgi:adenylosuccinate synthase